MGKKTTIKKTVLKSAHTASSKKITKVEIVELQNAEKVAKMLSQKTAQQIIDFIANHTGCTTTEIAKGLTIPLSTVHYNLKGLIKAKIIDDSSFHYSSKGKEVTHYELMKKIIVIVPKNEPSLLAQLTTVLPGLLLVAIIGAIAFGKNLLNKTVNMFSKEIQTVAKAGADSSILATNNSPASTTTISQSTLQALLQEKNFLIIAGIIIVIIILGMILFWFIKKTIRK